MSALHETQEYQEALHFCTNNGMEIIVRQMASDMIRIKELQEQLKYPVPDPDSI
jgi:hypothetical protein